MINTLQTILIILGISLLHAKVSIAPQSGSEVLIEFTNVDKQFNTQPSQSFKSGTSPQGNIITVDDSQTFQKLDGFGASFTDSTAYLMKNLPEKERWDVLRKLFDPHNGIGISYIRLPISVTDFSLTNYTYDNMPPGKTDPLLQNFSLAHDEEYIIPLLKDILTLNPKLQIIVSPWTAPAWMKNTDDLMGTTDGVSSFLKPEFYASYALYFVKIIQGYARHGITIQTMTIQNEVLYGPDSYPGMTMSKEAQTTFLNNYLGPAFISAGINTKVMVFDHNWIDADYPEYVLGHLNLFSSKIVGGTAIHCYDGEVTNQTRIHDKFPNFPIYMTECSGFDYRTDFTEVLLYDMQNLLIGVVNNWGSVSIKWNIALDQNKGPQNGGCPNCLGLIEINTDTGKVKYNPDYYTVGIFSRFALPGSVRIQVTSNNDNLLVTGFKRPDGTIAVVVLNQGKTDQNFSLNWNNSFIQVTIPKVTVGVYVWSP